MPLDQLASRCKDYTNYIKGNKAVDTIAGKGSETGLIAPEPAVSFSY